MRAAQEQRKAQPADGPSYDDLRVESAVLSYVAANEGEALTVPKLARELGAELGESETGTAIERAIREMVRARILRCEGSIVKATR